MTDWPDAPEFRRSWQPIDLSDVLDGKWEPPTPTVGQRSDGIGLFYPGKVHTVSSESEAGKTWFALSAVLDELTRGNRVVYIDFEDDEGGITSRLLTLGAHRSVLRERFRYLHPEDPLGSGINLDDLHAVLSGHPTLVIIDGITEAMTLHDLDPLKNKEIAAFGRILPRRIAALGSAVACLDHVVKDREGRGRYALGGVHKLNGLDGAAYVLDNRAPFGVGITGKSTIRIAKDRIGQLRRHGFPSAGGMYWFGDMVLESHGDEFAEATIDPPHERDENFRPTTLMERVAKAIEQHGPLAQRRLDAAVTGKSTSIRAALDYLILDGYVSDQSPHKLLKTYPPPAGTE